MSLIASVLPEYATSIIAQHTTTPIMIASDMLLYERVVVLLCEKRKLCGERGPSARRSLIYFAM